jgi:hypothetical protein
VLTFEDVEHHLSCLPAELVERLSLGPLDDDEGDACRVCQVFEQARTTLSRRQALHVQELTNWHDVDVGTVFEIAEQVDEDLDQLPTSGVLRELLGSLSYARCTTIYALARHLTGVYRTA